MCYEEKIRKDKLKDYLTTLDKNNTYTLLLIIRNINSENGFTEGLSTGKVILITKEVNPQLLATNFIIKLQSTLFKYAFDETVSEAIIMSKEWVPVKSFFLSLLL